jgi:hypothetical protein
MKLSSFESEYADSALPTFQGKPAGHDEVRISSDVETPWTQMSALLETTVLQAVQSFYLAKRSRQYFSDLPENGDRVGQAIEHINNRLMRLAVLDIAALNDGGLGFRDPEHTRVASLPIAHNRMKKHLENANASSAELDQLRKLRSDIDCNRYMPLLYVRHLRNKWAGHPSLDRRFDAWADANKTLSVAAVEAALVRLVNTTHGTALFVSSAPALQDFRQPPAVANPDGSRPMEVDLSNVIVWADVMRDSADKEVRALRAQITGKTMLERFAHTEAYRGEQY